MSVKKIRMNLENYTRIKKSLSKEIKLVAVSKGQPISKILSLYKYGHRDFGENYLQELIQKRAELPKDIIWHFLGNIQTNKIKEICKNSDFIHSISRPKVLNKIVSLRLDNKPKILLQLKLGEEESKSGFTSEEIKNIFSEDSYKETVQIQGLMGISENTDDINMIRKQFLKISSLYEELSVTYRGLKFLSLGMSKDYDIALDFGSNIIRLGSIIFGERK